MPLDIPNRPNSTGLPTGGNLYVDLLDPNGGIPTTGNSGTVKKEKIYLAEFPQ